MKVTIDFVLLTRYNKSMQQEEHTVLTDEQKKRKKQNKLYLSRYSRASLVLVYFLALFVLIGSLLASREADIIQWNWAIQVSLAFLIIAGVSWVVHVVAAFKMALAKSEKDILNASMLKNTFGILFYPYLLVGVVFLVVAILT